MLTDLSLCISHNDFGDFLIFKYLMDGFTMYTSYIV